MKQTWVMCIALAAAVAFGCNRADRTDVAGNPDTGTVGTSGTNDRNKVNSGDRDFVHDITIANMAEIELGKLATDHAANPEVKKFGRMMVDDHTKAGNQLKSVASQHNIEVPNQLDDKHNDLRDKLSKLQGADFDREYMDAMVDGHQDVADKLESRIDKNSLQNWKTGMADRTEGGKTQDRNQNATVTPEKSDNAVTTSINRWAADTYPTVQKHLDTAKTLKTNLNRRTTN